MADRWITINELSDKLSISVATIRGWIRRGTMPSSCYLQIGGAYRFDLDTIVEEFRGRSRDRPAPDTSNQPVQLELDLGEEHRILRNTNNLSTN